MGDSFFVNPGNSRKRSRAGRPPAGNGQRSQKHGRIAADNGGSKRGAGADASADEDITSESEDEDGAVASQDEVSDESDHESAADKRRRLAKEYLSSLETELVDGFDAKDLDEDIIARRLKHDAAEQQGHIFRDLSASKPANLRKTRVSGQRNLTAVASGHDFVYLGSKDGNISKWALPSTGPESSSVKSTKPRLTKRRRLGKAVFCLTVNSASKLVVVGHTRGFTVLNAESLETLREFKLIGDVLSAVFRRNSSELYVGGSDLRLRTYDLTQWAFVETLHGHQDVILGLSALNRERCVSVGARDRTAIFWKIPEESRLTFRGGDTKLAARYANIPLTDTALRQEARDATLEGSIDCCAMLDHQLFVTGSDNGNVCLWTTNRKKPQHLEPLGHGRDDPLPAERASGETDASHVEIPPQRPRSITAIASVPFSNVFFTGSWSGTIKMWALAEDQRSFSLQAEVDAGKGIVTSLDIAEINGKYTVVASLSREPRLGRWLVASGRDQLVSFTLGSSS